MTEEKPIRRVYVWRERGRIFKGMSMFHYSVLDSSGEIGKGEEIDYLIGNDRDPIALSRRIESIARTWDCEVFLNVDDKGNSFPLGDSERHFRYDLMDKRTGEKKPIKVT